MDFGKGELPPGELSLESFQPFLEAGLRGGQVEDEVAHLAPEIVAVLPADDAHRPLKRFACQPQFAVERHAGQLGREPGWSVERVP